MHHLFCLLGMHRYRKPTHGGGLRCQCGRVRYGLHWWMPAAGSARRLGLDGTGTPHACTLAELAEMGLLGGDDAIGRTRGRREDQAMSIVFLTLASDDELRRFSVADGPRCHAARAIGRERPAEMALIQKSGHAGAASP